MIDWTRHTIGTSRDPERQAQRNAINYLNQANDTRRAYDIALTLAFRMYGDGNGIAISGVCREHFPETVKGELRKILSSLNLCNHNAAVLWRRAGRRMETFRPLLELARQLPDGRVSYY